MSRLLSIVVFQHFYSLHLAGHIEKVADNIRIILPIFTTLLKFFPVNKTCGVLPA